MNRLLTLLALAVTATALVACDAFGSDDGGGSSSSASDEEDDSTDDELALESVLRPFFGVTSDQDLRIAIGRLPAGFPEDFPIPPGAEPITGIAATPALNGALIVTFETDEGPDELLSFYEEELGSDAVVRLARGENNLLQFEQEDGLNGQIIVGEFDEGSDESTMILTIVPPEGEEPEETAEEGEEFALPESLTLPSGFPDDLIPLYPDSTVIQTDFQAGQGETGGLRQFSITSVTEDDFEPIIEFYEEELEASGYTVSTSDEGSVVQISFEDEENPDLSGVLQINVFEQDPQLTAITIQVAAETEDA
ncbi:MAG TPA: hypothetical protein VFO84_05660 [Dehalococcoidia bacterium]|nr:hypothetical protein [Dehalococcoidia bacterium]